MAEIAFPSQCKTFTTLSTSTRYSYIHIPPTSPSKATILFLHGFPSSSYDWRHQISHFSSLGYGIVVPDLLGYGATDKPTNPTAYSAKKMATEVIEILDHENVGKFHAVGHDFGSHLLSRVVNYFPDRILSASFLAVPYFPPGGRFDLDVLKGITEKSLGFEKFGYMRFMNSEDSAALLDAHTESATSLMYTATHSDAKHFFLPNALKTYLIADRRSPPSPYISPQETSIHNQILTTGGWQGPTNWYRALIGGVNEEIEKLALEAGAIDPQITCPVLAIDSQPGEATLPGFMEGSIKPFAADFRASVVGTEGHFVQIESKDEVNKILGDFFDEVDGR